MDKLIKIKDFLKKNKLPVILLLMAVAYLAFVIYVCKYVRCKEYGTRKVIKIGGCNNEGMCGVQYDDKSFGREHYPVVGKTVTNHRKCLDKDY